MHWTFTELREKSDGHQIQKTIDETARRRSIQMDYNEKHGKSPQPLVKSKEKMIVIGSKSKVEVEETYAMVAEKPVEYSNKEELKKQIAATKKAMEKAAKELDFIEAARLRDMLFELQALI